MEHSPLNLDRQLCFRVYTASRLTIRLYKPFLDKLKLTYPQYVTMMVLWEQKKIGFRTLGKTLHMSTGTLTPIIQKLVKLGYVEKVKDPEDDRKVMVVLTELGENLIAEAEKIPGKIACAMKVTEKEYHEYASMLDDLIDKLIHIDDDALAE